MLNATKRKPNAAGKWLYIATGKISKDSNLWNLKLLFVDADVVAL